MEDESFMRIRCLELAMAVGPQDAVTVAREFLAFVRGEDGQTAREKIDAALEQAGVR